MQRVPRSSFLSGGLVVVALLCASPSPGVAADTIKIGGSGGIMRTMEILGEAFERSQPGGKVAVVRGLGSRGGKKALIEGVIDVAMVADPLSAADREQGMVAQAFSRTPFVFATSDTVNPPRLTFQQLVDIYSGKTLAWPDGKRLRLILRPEGDSDTTTLKKMSPAMQEAITSAHTRPGLRIAAGDQDAAEAIAAVPGALGTSTLALIVSEQRPLKPVALNGVVPTPEAVANGTYPYFKTYYVVTRQSPSALAQRFIAFIRSIQGRDVIARLGQTAP